MANTGVNTNWTRPENHTQVIQGYISMVTVTSMIYLSTLSIFIYNDVNFYDVDNFCNFYDLGYIQP